MVVDETTGIVYVTLPEQGTPGVYNAVRLIAINIVPSVPVIVHNQVYPFSQNYNSSEIPVKSTPVIRDGELYIPRHREILYVDLTSWVATSIIAFQIYVDRLVLDARTNLVIGTSSGQTYAETGTNHTGVISIAGPLSGYYAQTLDGEYTWATTSILPWTNGSVANFAALPLGRPSGEVYKTLDSGYSYMSDGFDGWAECDTQMYLSEPRGGNNNDVDRLTRFTTDSMGGNAGWDVAPAPQNSLYFNQSNVRFPDGGLWVRDGFSGYTAGSYLPNMSYNQT